MAPQPAPPALPFPGTKTDDFMAEPSSYQLGLPGTGEGREPGGKGQPELWLLWHRLGLCGLSAAAFKSAWPRPFSGVPAAPAIRAHGRLS